MSYILYLNGHEENFKYVSTILTIIKSSNSSLKLFSEIEKKKPRNSVPGLGQSLWSTKFNSARPEYIAASCGPLWVITRLQSKDLQRVITRISATENFCLCQFYALIFSYILMNLSSFQNLPRNKLKYRACGIGFCLQNRVVKE